MKTDTKKYSISRAINGVTVNGKEYVLDDDGEVRLFDTKEEALELIGVTSEEDAECIGIYLEEEEPCQSK